MKQVILKPIQENKNLVEEIRKRILKILKEEIYSPIIEEITDEETSVLKNAVDTHLKKAISKGTVTFDRGIFRGKLSAAISKDLKKMGAKWDGQTKTFRIHFSKLPLDIQETINSSQAKLKQKFKKIDDHLKKIVPKDIADRIKVDDIFDSSLWDLDKKFKGQIQSITVAPTLTEEQRKKLSKEYQKTTQLKIKKFTQEEVERLRKQVTKNFKEGMRYENLVSYIQKSYGVSENKAKFLARQETNLLTHKYHQLKAEEIGSEKYMWQCVIGTPLHPTRPRHKELNGSIHSWDKPPIVSEPDQKVRRAHPGQDFNCRCIARMVLDLKK